MEKLLFNGNCPQCQLQNNTQKMYVNTDNDLECPICNLKVYHDNKSIAIIYRNRGKNEFKLIQPTKIQTQITFTQTDIQTDQYTNGKTITTKKELQEYLQLTNTKTGYNLNLILIYSFIDYFFNNKNEHYYQLISQITNIDVAQITYTHNNQTTKNQYKKLVNALVALNNKEYNFLKQDKIWETIKQDIFLQKIATENIAIQLIKKLYQPNQPEYQNN